MKPAADSGLICGVNGDFLDMRIGGLAVCLSGVEKKIKHIRAIQKSSF